ncbi:aminopeptidase P family protein [Pelagibacteraceae bacterium]|nr:aminopeptidase P family protein [Pelagibacteraceae bacterium]
MINQSNLKKLQNLLKEKDTDIFVINRSDEYLNEYISPNAERLNFITNFSGSAGRAIITPTDAFLYVDGRYTFQANTQINAKEIKAKHLNSFWIDLEKILLEKELKIALDPTLHSIIEIEKVFKMLENSTSQLQLIDKNFVDLIWENQPKTQYTDIFDHPTSFAGQGRSEKLDILKKFLDQNKIDHYFVSGLDNIAWLLNLRADDIKYTPLLYSYLLISKNNKHSLYIKESAMPEVLKKEIKTLININNIENIRSIFNTIKPSDTIGLDFNSTTYYFLDLLIKKNINSKNLVNPCILLKAIKNKTEINGAKEANIRDGASLTKYICWLKTKMDININNEISAGKYLENLRIRNKFFHSLSFDTISAIGKNAALPHYRVNEESNTNFAINTIYLVDSGAQYYDGTTDITRTVVLGKATKQQKEMFTRVLKGHIALSRHTFKKGTKGADIDYLARSSLKEINCDYDHGTGHGIGSFLSVHEAPQRIAKKTMFESVELMPGMILSNEPGYYKLNEYGIRIENLILIKEDKNNYLYFENISWCPIDTELINKKLLIEEEVNWLNNYHAKVYSILEYDFKGEDLNWLKEVTNPI